MVELNRTRVQTFVIAKDVELIIIVGIALYSQGSSDNVRVFNHDKGKVRTLLLSEVVYSCNIHNQVDSPIETHSNCLCSCCWYAHLVFNIG